MFLTLPWEENVKFTERLALKELWCDLLLKMKPLSR